MGTLVKVKAMWLFLAVFLVWLCVKTFWKEETYVDKYTKEHVGHLVRSVFRKTEVNKAKVYVMMHNEDSSVETEAWADLTFILGTDLVYVTGLKYRRVEKEEIGSVGMVVHQGGMKGFRRLYDHRNILDEMMRMYPKRYQLVLQWNRKKVVKRVRRIVRKIVPAIRNAGAHMIAQKIVP